MSKHEDGGPAFPSDVRAVDSCGQERTQAQFSGMSLRDYFAAEALAALLASGPHDCDENGLADDAYLHADAMLKARES